MRAVVQRVKSASVQVSGENISEIGQGLMVLLGVEDGDSETDARYLADKILVMRIFEDEDGKMNKSLLDIGGELMVVSQFTLLADTRKGRRPSFVKAAPPEIALKLYEFILDIFRQKASKVATGEFQTHMVVNIANDGPVTLLLDSKKLF